MFITTVYKLYQRWITDDAKLFNMITYKLVFISLFCDRENDIFKMDKVYKWFSNKIIHKKHSYAYVT